MKNLICILCPRGCSLNVDDSFNVTGNFCPRGITYAKKEINNPERTLTTTVSVQLPGLPIYRLAVKSDKPLSKDLIFDAMKVINKVVITSKIKFGQVIISNILDTNVNIVATEEI